MIYLINKELKMLGPESTYIVPVTPDEPWNFPMPIYGLDIRMYKVPDIEYKSPPQAPPPSLERIQGSVPFISQYDILKTQPAVELFNPDVWTAFDVKTIEEFENLDTTPQDETPYEKQQRNILSKIAHPPHLTDHKRRERLANHAMKTMFSGRIPVNEEYDAHKMTEAARIKQMAIKDRAMELLGLIPRVDTGIKKINTTIKNYQGKTE